jgi:hypothetical protein
MPAVNQIATPVTESARRLTRERVCERHAASACRATGPDGRADMSVSVRWLTGTGLTNLWNERKRALSGFLNLEQVFAIAFLVRLSDQQLDESEDDSELILEVVCRFRTAHGSMPRSLPLGGMPLYLLIGQNRRRASLPCPARNRHGDSHDERLFERLRECRFGTLVFRNTSREGDDKHAAALAKVIVPTTGGREGYAEESRRGGQGAFRPVRLSPMARRLRQRVSSAPPSMLWATRADGVLVECVARLFVGGVYVEIRVDGAPTIGRTFTTSDEATRFSEHQRKLWGELSEPP